MKFYLAALFLLIFAGSAEAGTNGQIAEQSHSSAELSIIIPERMGTSAAPEMHFAPTALKKIATSASTTAIEISTNNDRESRVYSLVGIGSGTNAAFEIKRASGASRVVPYRVELERADEHKRANRLFPLRAETVLTSQDKSLDAIVRVELSELRPGEMMSGTLTVMLVPEWKIVMELTIPRRAGLRNQARDGLFACQLFFRPCRCSRSER